MSMTATEMIALRGLERDLPMMEDYIDATHSDMPTRKISFAEYLMHWNDAKESGNLFKLFNNQLIISKKISYEMSVDEMMSHSDCRHFYNSIHMMYRQITNVTMTVMHEFIGNARDYETLRINFAESRFFHNYRFEQIFSDNPDAMDFYKNSSLLAENVYKIETWLNNAVDCDGITCKSATLPKCSKRFALPEGIKPYRAVSRFLDMATAYVKEVMTEDDQYNAQDTMDAIEVMRTHLEEIRQEASMLTNQRKFTGTLSLSIHPFDYMTMSDPTNGWSSCMRWCDDDPGEYHSGTLEMLTSPCVVVAYLESKDRINPAGLNYSWNKKKWRELFVVDPMFISGVKGYPYNNTNLETVAFEMLADLARKNWNVEFSTKNIERVDGEESYHGMHLETNFMYNDWGYNFVNVMPVTGLNYDDLPDYYSYGENCYCICCGESRGIYNECDDEKSELLWCEHCDNSEICSCCGRRVRSGLLLAPDGQMVCSWCLDDYEPCTVCGNRHHPNDMTEIEIPVKIKYYDGWLTRTHYLHVCEGCAKEVQEMFCDPAWWSCNGYTTHATHIDKTGLAWIEKYIPDLYNDEDQRLYVRWEDEGDIPVKVWED